MVRINDDEETRTVYGECLVCGRGDSVQIDPKTSRMHDGHSDDSWDDFKLAAAMVGADRKPSRVPLARHVPRPRQHSRLRQTQDWRRRSVRR